MKLFYRPIFNEIYKRLIAKRKFIQVLIGPRQTGKTTLALQIKKQLKISTLYASADSPIIKGSSWIEQQWETIRAKIKKTKKRALLILDEIQKIPNWPETVKKMWDEDTMKNYNIMVLILGSASLLIQKGLSESLAGRFELIHITHWSFQEMKEAFGWDINKYIFFGGYPGSALLIDDFNRWVNYIKDSLIETTISRDILLMVRIDKPFLLHRLFELGCLYSGQILSYQKILGQLQDAGNTTTLAHYLQLLTSAGLLTGLQKYAGEKVRQRGSSPKFMVLNTALITALTGERFKEIKNNSSKWGHLFESAVGSYLYNQSIGKQIELYYWSGYNYEVDFILKKSNSIVVIEVKSGKEKNSLPGVDFFSKKFNVEKKLLVGKNGIPIDEFLSISTDDWFA